MWWVYYLVKRNAYKRLSHEFSSKEEGQIRLTDVFSVGEERGNKEIWSVIIASSVWRAISSWTGCRIQEQLNVAMLHVAFVLKTKRKYHVSITMPKKSGKTQNYPAHSADGIIVSSKLDVSLTRSAALLISNMDGNRVQRMEELIENKTKRLIMMANRS